MAQKEKRTASHLFTLRVWVEDVENGRFEIRGQVKHILTGETISFREWPPLLAFLEQKLAAQIPDEPST